MKSHLPSAVVLAALLLILCLHAVPAELSSLDSGTRTLASSEPGYLFCQEADTKYTDYTALIPSIPISATSTAPDITVNGASIGQFTARTSVDGAPYMAAAPVLFALYPDASISYWDGRLNVVNDKLTLRATEGAAYFQVNDRYIYAPDMVTNKNGQLLLPAQELSHALGCSLVINDETQDMVIRQVGPAVTANTYNETDLYWLSRAIYAEAGNQPMAGRIAVGTVILNRVANPAFPNTVEEVVFAPGQFSPVSNGTIYRAPDHDSVVAAMLCFDGVKEADDCLYFNVTSMYSWADRARTYYCTIGDHNFYL